MIVGSTPQGSLHVTQADHARFASELLSLFRLPELVGHPRRQRLLRAVAEHDNGWWEADAAPRLAADGSCALDFRAVAAELRQEIWLRGVERFADEDPYIAALLAAHALRLAERWRGEESWASFLGPVTSRLEELLQASGELPEALAEDDRWMCLADSLSLAVCAGEPGLLALPGWSLRLPAAGAGGAFPDQGIAVRLEPFPFAGVTAFELSCRWLAAERFASPAALGVALATSPWRRLRVRFAPL